MIATKSKTIDDVGYDVTQFPARRGLLVQAKLAKVLGPILGGAFAGKGEVDMGKALASLASVNPVEFCALALELLTSTRRNGKEISEASFDLDFAGGYLHLYKVLFFVIETNYGDFFGASGIGGLAARLMPSPESRAPAPSTSQ